ncbi:MAG: DUF4129 domain-containing protein [Candidatus Hydrogenedentes bacterium]|nr:DUF4129 domain-containing protein [Candidatus Hydrogenedentota bacterium]
MKRQRKGMPALDLIEEAVHLLRTAPLSYLAAYYVGALPFMLALLYYWVDMSRGAFSQDHAARGALMLAGLFVWMKAWQTVFASLVRSRLLNQQPPRWSMGRLVRMVQTQMILQTTGLILLPAAIVTTVPYIWVHTWYQNVTILGDGEDDDLWKVTTRAAGLARLWTTQNSLLIWLLSPALVMMAAALFLVILPVVEATTPGWTSSLVTVYAALFTLLMIPLSPLGLAIALNVGILIQVVPMLLESLLGIENVLTLGGEVTNPTYYAICCAATYLILDPVQKTAYTLRCFYGESLDTGEDLRVALLPYAKSAARTRVMIVAIALASLCGPSAAAEDSDTHVSPTELNEAIDRVLEQRDFAWRLDRYRGPQDETEKSYLTLFVEAVQQVLVNVFVTIRDWWETFTDWLRSFAPDSHKKTPGSWANWGAVPRYTMYVLLIVLAAVLLVFLARTWLKRGKPPVQVEATPVTLKPDVADESVGADALPEDGWITLARELMERGEWRLAMRALFLACLALLARHELIRVAKYKSNHEYVRELSRRAHSEPEILAAFSQSVATFERVWYGTHEAGPDLVKAFDEYQQRMRTLAERP